MSRGRGARGEVERFPYGPEPSQFGELRLPAGDGVGLFPVAVVIHGGFWRVRYGLDHIAPLCRALTREGIATWSLEYRRVGEPGGGWPGTLEDVRRGLLHLEALAARLPLDTGGVVLVGHSAGGHLALWLGAEAPLRLRGVVSLAGVTDLVRGAELDLSDGAVRDLLGGLPAAVPQRYATASPAVRLPLGVPQVLVHGEEDEDVPVSLSRDYAARAVTLGDDATLLLLPGTGHFEPVDPTSAAWPHVSGAVRRLLRLSR